MAKRRRRAPYKGILPSAGRPAAPPSVEQLDDLQAYLRAFREARKRAPFVRHASPELPLPLDAPTQLKLF